MDCHFIRDKFTQGIITLPHISTDQQIADLFKKSVTSTRHRFLLDKLSLIDISDENSENSPKPVIGSTEEDFLPSPRAFIRAALSEGESPPLDFCNKSCICMALKKSWL